VYAYINLSLLNKTARHCVIRKYSSQVTFYL
jgi:hypothetical protein